ncbi:MAG: response regulator transcription factor [Deltaproteobacteria bacterium]|nr:response regulator transcription factor [Deltaproteobacteria bacterium]
MPPYKIVLADDHTLFRNAIKRSIEKMPGLKVVGEASDGLELLELLKDVPADLIIADISMPNLRGIEATREIKQLYPDTHVLMLTMHKSREHLLSALQSGADGYLLKENAFSDLLAAIETVRQDKTYISSLLLDEVTDVMRDLSAGKVQEQEPLTLREIEVTKLIAEGRSAREIGELLNISIATVRTHRHNIKRKLNIKKQADLVKYAIRKGYTGSDA